MADITIRTKNGEVKTFSDVSREQLEQVISRAKNGEFEVLGKENKPINFHTDEKIDKPNPNAIKYPDMGNPVYNEMARHAIGALYGGGTGAAVGGHVGGVVGAVTNGIFPPNTYSEALLTPLMGKGLGKVSEVLSNVKGLQTVPRQFLTQGIASGAGNVAEGATNNFFEKLLDPNQSVKDTNLKPPNQTDLLQSLFFGTLGGGTGAYSQHIKQGVPKSPTVQATKVYDILKNESTEPYDLAKKAKELKSDKVPNASNTLSNVREQEAAYQNQLNLEKDEIKKQLAVLNKKKASGEISPERHSAQSQIVQIDKSLKDVDDYIGKLKNPPPSLLQQKDELTRQRMAAQEYIDNLNKKATSTAVGQIMQKLEKQPTTKPELDIKYIELQRKQADGKFDADVTPLIKGTKNAEEMFARLLDADPYQIRKFMTNVKVPDVREGVINEILNQSWDGKTFGNFNKIFEKSGNVKAKLTEILGSKDQAERALEAVELMNEGLVKSQAINSESRTIRGVAKAHMMWQGAKHALTGMGSTLAAEQAALHVLKIPTMVEKVVQDKDKFERWKKWMQTGMTKEFIQKGNPLYQELLDMGDKYTYDDYGNPKLISK